MATATETKPEKKVEILNTSTRNISVDVQVGGKTETFNWEPSLKKAGSLLTTKVVVTAGVFEELKKKKGFAAMLEDNTFSIKHV